MSNSLAYEDTTNDAMTADHEDAERASYDLWDIEFHYPVRHDVTPDGYQYLVTRDGAFKIYYGPTQDPSDPDLYGFTWTRYWNDSGIWENDGGDGAETFGEMRAALIRWAKYSTRNIRD